MVLLNREQIKTVIPQREPFLLIDEVIGLEPGRKCIAKKYLTQEDFWVPGHFPGMPVTPAVMTIEMLAQTGAVCIGVHEEYKGRVALFAKIDKAKFKRQLVPGDVVVLEMEMLKLRSNVGVGRAKASVGGEVAVTADLTFAFGKPEREKKSIWAKKDSAEKK
ncbi:MAG: 3-hydroxyacyl-ACP dehydratase FabZ [Oscillospiraceae bacterium]|nr:3-hydroxyacyl-ACP dehydratase FabZ [Oscillospiraceae bacterium]